MIIGVMTFYLIIDLVIVNHESSIGSRIIVKCYTVKLTGNGKSKIIYASVDMKVENGVYSLKNI
jgi:hypothetical protein